jgi:hypothetical protein
MIEDKIKVLIEEWRNRAIKIGDSAFDALKQGISDNALLYSKESEILNKCADVLEKILK